MKLNIREGIAGHHGHEYAERRLNMALGRHQERVAHVAVRIEKEGVWTKCRILVSLRKPEATGEERHVQRTIGGRVAKASPLTSQRMIVVEASSDDVFEAIDHAAERAAVRVVRECERALERPSERVISRLLAEQELEPERKSA
jgi:ribosome-associated translation inhibitor RaiA